MPNPYPTKSTLNIGGKLTVNEGTIDLNAKPIERVSNYALIKALKEKTGINNPEDACSNACKQVLLDAGVRTPGQTIRVNSGRYKGFEGVIETINWTECEVKCEKNPRWFSLWVNRNYFTVLDPSEAPAPRAATLSTSDSEASKPPLAGRTNSQVSQEQTNISEPQIAPLSWMPSRKT